MLCRKFELCLTRSITFICVLYMYVYMYVCVPYMVLSSKMCVSIITDSTYLKIVIIQLVIAKRLNIITQRRMCLFLSVYKQIRQGLH